MEDRVKQLALECALEMARKSPGGSVSHLEGASCEYGYKHGYLQGEDDAKKACFNEVNTALKLVGESLRDFAELKKAAEEATIAAYMMSKVLDRIKRGLDQGISTVKDSIPHADAKYELERFNRFLNEYNMTLKRIEGRNEKR